MKKGILLLAAITAILFSCNNQNTEKITVASERGECIGVAAMDCYLIKKEGKKDWELFYDNIEGFNHIPGYEYVIEIKKEQRQNPAADQSIYKYALVKEISKTQKNSENLPY